MSFKIISRVARWSPHSKKGLGSIPRSGCSVWSLYAHQKNVWVYSRSVSLNSHKQVRWIRGTKWSRTVIDIKLIKLIIKILDEHQIRFGRHSLQLNSPAPRIIIKGILFHKANDVLIRAGANPPHPHCYKSLYVIW